MLINERNVLLVAQPILRRAPKDRRNCITLFGVSSKIVATIYNVTPFDASLNIKLEHVLWALAFLKSYLKESTMIALVGGPSRPTFRKYIWSVLGSFSSKSHAMIRWENRFRKDKGRTCKVSVDGTDFLIPRQKPHRIDKQYYSHKFKHAALRYEVAVCIQTGDIVWINGPFRAGKWPDINIFRRNLKQMLLPGEMVEADLGYRDNRCRHCDVVGNHRDARAKSRAMR